jgi:tRNA(Ile)-lysidine synthase
MNSIITTLYDDCGFRKGDSILVACSGGADSVALLMALHESGIPIAAAHVNYHLRGQESDNDEAYVASLCSTLQIPLYIRNSSAEELESVSANLQNAARKIRYDFFHSVCGAEQISLIAVAHHSDDQLETVLMNFLRGAGVNGLSGMKFRDGKIIRPLLGETKESLEEYLKSRNVSWRDDSSNATDDYLRNRIRHHLIPVIKQFDERQGSGWVKSVQNMNETSLLIEELCRIHSEQIVHPHKDGIHFRKAALKHAPSPHLLLNYLLREEGFEHHFSLSDFELLLSAQPGKKIESNGMTLFVDREDFVLTAITNSFSEIRLSPELGELHGWSCRFISGEDPAKFIGKEALLNVDLSTGELLARPWEEGDHMIPYGFHGTKKVSDILNEIKVPVHLKKQYPVVVFNNEVVWIPGYRIADKFKITDINSKAVHLKWND